MRYELSDSEWATIRPMLPNKARGVPRVATDDGELRVRSTSRLLKMALADDCIDFGWSV